MSVLSCWLMDPLKNWKKPVESKFWVFWFKNMIRVSDQCRSLFPFFILNEYFGEGLIEVLMKHTYY